MQIRVFNIVCVLGLVFLGPGSAVAKQKSAADPFIPAIESVKRSVIPVVCGKFVNGQFVTQIFEGTAFFVDTVGHFITPNHVIHDLEMITPQQPVHCVRAIFIPQDGWQREALTINYRWMLIDKCEGDDTLDLAVCTTIDKVTNAVSVTFLDAKPADGTAVAFSGFPLGIPQPLTTRCNIAAYQGTVDAEGTRVMMLDKGNWPGASGSPIFMEDGTVIGILLARGTMDSAGITMGRPTHFVLQFLSAHRISIQTATSSQKNKSR